MSVEKEWRGGSSAMPASRLRLRTGATVNLDAPTRARPGSDAKHPDYGPAPSGIFPVLPLCLSFSPALREERDAHKGTTCPFSTGKDALFQREANSFLLSLLARRSALLHHHR